MGKFNIGFALVLTFLPEIVLAQSITSFDTLLSSRETVFFIAVNIFLTIYFGHIRFNRFAVAHGPEILTTTGILGCFLGIALALLEFDTKDITHSVPSLLEGIKTAFWASVTGIMGALYIRFRHHSTKEPIPQDPNLVKSASLDDVVSSMNALRAGLVGDEQGTLLTQFKLLRQENKDQQTELLLSFNKFAEHMVENNQKAIVEALRQVIADFNQKLTEQFGDNFKQLNSAVEKLVLWQQQYKEELNSIKDTQLQAASDFRSASESLAITVQRAERFAEIADSLNSVLELLSAQKDTLYKQERELADVLGMMKDVTPMFATKVTEMLTDLKSGIGTMQSEVSTLTKNFGVQVQSSHVEMKNLLTDVLRTAQKDISASLTDNAKVIKEGVLTLDKALQKELNDSLEALGRQLASLSGRFVEDYTPLTERLREVVQMAKATRG